ncbi:bifunctional phosphopantothenoylcysteine decarboxylase/phosphopantothenate--cysteine ligase CoaBC [Arenimonas alkanexedens]
MAGLDGQRILLGVSGGIAAYKSADLLRRLQDAGAEVRVVMTASALHFVGATTFQALSRHPVRSSLWDEAAEAAMSHIELARWATRILIAPATANVVAKLAQGRANDLLSTLCLASEAPVMLAPAMNRVMWAHPATRANVATLTSRGVAFIGPGEGDQACGETGPGRLLEPFQIVEAVIAACAPQRLAGRRVLVSAGPTFEDIDPVRFIGNRSSGKMGFALAAAARALGAEVTLVAGPVSLPTPPGVRRIDVRRAAAMRAAILAELPGQDVYLGAAAVADYAPAETLPQKIKKSGETMNIALVRSPDILAEVAAHPQRPQLVVGFAAETQEVEGYAREKLLRKGLDLIAANDVARAGQGFESDNNALTVFWRDGSQDIALGPKPRVAHDLLALVADHLEAKA